jgi:hypothetical protein
MKIDQSDELSERSEFSFDRFSSDRFRGPAKQARRVETRPFLHTLLERAKEYGGVRGRDPAVSRLSLTNKTNTVGSLPDRSLHFFLAQRKRSKRNIPNLSHPTIGSPLCGIFSSCAHLRSPHRKMKNPLFGGFTWGPDKGSG